MFTDPVRKQQAVGNYLIQEEFVLIIGEGNCILSVAWETQFLFPYQTIEEITPIRNSFEQILSNSGSFIFIFDIKA